MENQRNPFLLNHKSETEIKQDHLVFAETVVKEMERFNGIQTVEFLDHIKQRIISIYEYDITGTESKLKDLIEIKDRIKSL